MLFLATFATTTWVYSTSYTDSRTLPYERYLESVLFAGCVLLILGAHEMGHYLMARQHGVDSSLPYFIPVPFAFGTMGAVIRLRSRISTRNALVDIGAAGPLAGLAIAIPLLLAGVALGHVSAAPPPPPLIPGTTSLWGLGNALYDWLTSGAPPPSHYTEGFGDNLLTLAAVRLVKGPLLAGQDLYVDGNPVFLAAWFGLLVTMLNLVPVGQLDGGHLTHAWLGSRAIPLGKVLAGGMAAMAFFCSFSWVPWLLLTSLLVGFRHPEVLEPDVPLSRGRKLVCAICFIFFVLTLMPVPLGISSL